MVNLVAAHQWLATHEKQAEKYTGQWVAVTENGIAAANTNVKTLMATIEGLKLKKPTHYPNPHGRRRLIHPITKSGGTPCNCSRTEKQTTDTSQPSPSN